MGRLTLFAKGNLDLRDSLVALRNGEDVLWNGVNEIVRQRCPGDVMRVRHELWTRSDALLEAGGEPPPGLVARNLQLQPHSCASQFSRTVFDGGSDVVVLSIQPDVMTNLARHRTEGYLLEPHNFWTWPEADRLWFREAFRPLPALDVEQSMRNLQSIITQIRRTSGAAILVYNLSAVIPGETAHVHAPGPDDFSTRIMRFNLALIDLARATGVSIIDVDRVIARAGADALKIDAAHLTAAGCRLVAEEVVRVIEDLGLLPVLAAARRAAEGSVES